MKDDLDVRNWYASHRLSDEALARITHSSRRSSRWRAMGLVALAAAVLAVAGGGPNVPRGAPPPPVSAAPILVDPLPDDLEPEPTPPPQTVPRQGCREVRMVRGKATYRVWVRDDGELCTPPTPRGEDPEGCGNVTVIRGSARTRVDDRGQPCDTPRPPEDCIEIAMVQGDETFIRWVDEKGNPCPQGTRR